MSRVLRSRSLQSCSGCLPRTPSSPPRPVCHQLVPRFSTGLLNVSCVAALRPRAKSQKRSSGHCATHAQVVGRSSDGWSSLVSLLVAVSQL
jgi:hypothetical protein